jgi:hypothetical protein
MKLSWFAKEFTAVLLALAFSIISLIWAIVEASDSPHQYSVVAIGFAGGFISILIEFIVAYRNGTLFLKDKKVVAAKKAKNVKLARLLFMPAVAFGIVFAYFPGSAKVFLLSLAAGYLLPYSFGLLVHFLKNHKEIEKISKDL